VGKRTPVRVNIDSSTRVKRARSVKGACDPLTGDKPRIGAKRQIGSRNLWENAKRQVWNTILKREAAAVGRIHVYFAEGA
jgi:hypothetical protein